MKQILSVMIALAFTLSGVVGHTSMVMDGAVMGNGVAEYATVSSHTAHEEADHAPASEHHDESSPCAVACAVAWGFLKPPHQLNQIDFVLAGPTAGELPALLSTITGFDPPPPKA